MELDNLISALADEKGIIDLREKYELLKGRYENIRKKIPKNLKKCKMAEQGLEKLKDMLDEGIEVINRCEAKEIEMKMSYSGIKTNPEKINEYSSVKKLGTGGFSHIFLSERFGEFYVLKLIHSEKMSQRRAKFYFDREAYMMTLLSSVKEDYVPHLVDILNVEQYNLLVLPYLRGRDLIDLFSHFNGRNNPFANLDLFVIKEMITFKMLLEIGEALKAIHDQDIIHMDVKPDNIFYDIDRKRFKLIDFGLSLTLREDYASVLPDKSPYGTDGYVAEYMFDVDWHDPDTEELLLMTDSFALGVAAFYCNESYFPFGYKQNSRYDRWQPIGFSRIKSIPLQTILTKLLRDNVMIEKLLPDLKIQFKKLPQEEIHFALSFLASHLALKS